MPDPFPLETQGIDKQIVTTCCNKELGWRHLWSDNNMKPSLQGAESPNKKVAFKSER